MLEKISWSHYWMVIGATTALYYLGIGIRFYGKKIIPSFSRNVSPRTNFPSHNSAINVMGALSPENNQAEEETLEVSKQETPPEEIPENIRTLDKTTETGNQITEALSSLGTNTDSKELISKLSAIIQKQNLTGELTPFRDSLNWHMSQAALDSCGIVLEEENLKAVWKKE
jgi:hypothetical protein